MSEHPNAIRLDALALGDRDDDAKAHVDGCSECAAYVASVAREAAAFAASEGARADDFARAVVARSAARAKTKRLSPGWPVSAATALALAAAVALFVRTQAPPSRATTPPSVATARPKVVEGPVRFKGGVQLAVVVDHHGTQTRRTGAIDLEPGDRVRLEIAIDHRMQAAAGVLADSGEWAELEPPTWLDPGTHFSERSVAFEGDVPSGVVVFGEAEAVARARATRALDGVTTMRVGQKHP